ncbi:MAG: hypothetical protein F4166_07380 [Gammaproteobacteria bacterium]|nr:hypothetical protein [Gammaproteobacteria bacterium]
MMTNESKRLNDLRIEVLQKCLNDFDMDKMIRDVLSDRVNDGIDQVFESRVQAVAREKVYRLLRVARENDYSLDDLLDDHERECLNDTSSQCVVLWCSVVLHT